MTFQHRLMVVEDLNDPDLLCQMASKLARFHAMTPPLAKDSRIFETFLTSSAKKLKESPEKWRKLFESYECKALLDCDMSSEVKWLLELIPTFESPIVFSHNDFRFRNQMITKDNEVVLGDFEISSYNYRGYDFAYLFDDIDPNEEVVSLFINEYLKEGHKLFGKSYSENAINSVDHILKEIKQFSMLCSLNVGNFFLHNDLFKFPMSVKTSMVSLYALFCYYFAFKPLLLFSECLQLFNRKIFVEKELIFGRKHYLRTLGHLTWSHQLF